MGEKVNKRTLKKRIYRLVSLLNCGSLLIMLIAMMFSLGFTFNIFGNLISENVGQQMSVKLSNDWNRAIQIGKIPKNFKTLTPGYIDMFSKLGGSYTFFSPGSDSQDISKVTKEKMNTGTMLMSNGKTIQGNINKQKDNTPIDAVSTSNVKIIRNSVISNGTTIIKNVSKGLLPNLLAVEYKIIKNNKLIYDSSAGNAMGIMGKTPSKDPWFMKLLNTTSIIEIKNDNGKELAKLEVKLNPEIIFIGYICLVSLCLIVFLITLIISKIGTRMLSTMVVKPLADLDRKMNQLAKGDLDAAMNNEIVLKKPVKEVENLANSSNMIMSRMHDYVNTLAVQKLELEAQNFDLMDNGRSLETVNLTLAHRNSKLKNILDNVEQGFFTFKRDLMIHSEYSLICEKIFNECICDRKLSSIIFKDNQNMQKFMNDLLVKIFDETGSERKKYMPLLPEEININNCVINISYKIVKDEMKEENIMVIITDITEKRLLEKRMDEERKILKMVVKSIINRIEFLDLVKEYEEFASQKHDEVSTNEYDQILRQIHTFKGNFSQYDMVNLVPMLNELEDKLYEKGTEFSLVDVDNSELLEWLHADIDIIVSYAGSDFMKDGEYCYIKKEKLIEIEKKIQQTLSKQECKVILPLIKNLRYKSVKDLLKTYPDYVMKLSERLEKSIKLMEITGDEVLVDTNYYTKLTKSLTHIFRNCIDHGIETEDERLEIGKEQTGNITCEVKELDKSFEIIIADDGRGINVEALEEKVLSEGLYTKSEWEKMTIKQKYDLIFEQGITTKEEATFISGRGVGMSAVRECVVELGGSLNVDSSPGKGTIFTIVIPRLEDMETSVITSEKFMEVLIETSKEIIMRHTGNNFISEGIKYQNTILLNNITALISLSGTLNSIIMISVNRDMANSLAKGFILEDVGENEIASYIEDVLGELSNTILGNTFGKFENVKGIFHIGLPAVLSNNEAYIKYTQSQIISSNLKCEDFEFSINMLLVEDEIDTNDVEEEF